MTSHPQSPLRQLGHGARHLPMCRQTRQHIGSPLWSICGHAMSKCGRCGNKCKPSGVWAWAAQRGWTMPVCMPTCAPLGYGANTTAAPGTAFALARQAALKAGQKSAAWKRPANRPDQRLVGIKKNASALIKTPAIPSGSATINTVATTATTVDVYQYSSAAAAAIVTSFKKSVPMRLTLPNQPQTRHGQQH